MADSLAAFAQDDGYVPQELIVAFKQGVTPQELTMARDDRWQRGNTFIVGPVRLLLEDIGFRVAGEDSPERKFVRMQSANQSIGVVSIRPFYASDDSFSRVYILQLNGSVDVPVAADYYRRLPEIEFVEPNYMYSDRGI